MRRVCVLLPVLAAAAPAGPASAQGIALFGSARLGVGYNIVNDGEPALEAARAERVTRVDPSTGEEVTETVETVLGGADDLRAVSRIRFGATLLGESDSGITFGGETRADNAEGGDGDDNGQTGGEVFVSGAWGR